MKYSLDFDLFIKQAVSDAFGRYALTGSNLDRLAGLAARDLTNDWGPELAEVFKVAILAEMESDMNDVLK